MTLRYGMRRDMLIAMIRTAKTIKEANDMIEAYTSRNGYKAKWQFLVDWFSASVKQITPSKSIFPDTQAKENYLSALAVIVGENISN